MLGRGGGALPGVLPAAAAALKPQEEREALALAPLPLSTTAIAIILTPNPLLDTQNVRWYNVEWQLIALKLLQQFNGLSNEVYVKCNMPYPKMKAINGPAPSLTAIRKQNL